jgi:hypothetical protein
MFGLLVDLIFQVKQSAAASLDDGVGPVEVRVLLHEELLGKQGLGLLDLLRWSHFGCNRGLALA